jgi:hypothetical protein
MSIILWVPPLFHFHPHSFDDNGFIDPLIISFHTGKADILFRVIKIKVILGLENDLAFSNQLMNIAAVPFP